MEWTEREAARFWSKVDKGDGSGCWEWTANRPGGRYGYMYFRGKEALAHRLLFQILHGVLERHEVVMHTCDNVACVRPDHLARGTQKTNVRDMNEKGRGPNRKGQQNGRAKLTEEDVRTIRASSEPGPMLAARYGVTGTVINRIRRRESWKHVA